MRERVRGRTYAWAAWAFVTSLALLSLALRQSNVAHLLAGAHLSGPEFISEVLWWAVLIPAAVPAYATVGAVVASRRPSNGIGWLCLALGFFVALQDVAWQYADFSSGGALPARVPAAWISQTLGSNLTTLLPFALILLIFPSGSFLSRRWRFVAWGAVFGAALSAASSAFYPTLGIGLSEQIPNPLGLGGLKAALDAANQAGTALSVLALLAALFCVFIRWRVAGGTERRQLKWLAYVGAIVALAVVCGAASGLTTGLSYPTVGFLSVALFGATVGTPLAVGVAILRYRLYDVDRIINRTLVYAALSAMLAAVYLACVVTLQEVFRAVSGQGTSLAVVASTLAIAALFNPLRRRVQSFIDRRFYRRRYDAQKTLDGFAARLRERTDLDDLGQDLVLVVRRTMQPESVRLWLGSSEPRREPEGKLLEEAEKGVP